MLTISDCQALPSLAELCGNAFISPPSTPPVVELRRAFAQPVPLAVDPDTGEIVSIPSGIQPGVWTIYVQSHCGCFVAPVNVKCSQPAFVPRREDSIQSASPECDPPTL